jgi:hypothetical protein
MRLSGSWGKTFDRGRFRATLSAYLDGELNSRHAENVEKHLATCDSCAALLEDLRGTRALLSALPSHTPGRSFVLGAEYARTPVRDAAPSKRFSLVLAPAVAASVFVALLFVDFADFSSSTSSDETQFTAALDRQATDDASSSAGSLGATGGAGAPSAAQAPEAANSTADGSDSPATKSAEAEATPESGAGSGPAAGGVGGGIATPEGPPAALSSEAQATPAPDVARDAAVTGETEEAPSPEPLAFEAPADDSDGVSTLRLLQIVAAVAFLASGLYVFVWPRISRGGS